MSTTGNGGAAGTNEHRPVIVTGGGRGIGRGAARALALAGHPVCVNDNGTTVHGSDPESRPADQAAAEIIESGGRALPSSLDARSPGAARRLVAEVEAWAGRPPAVLVHAAGSLRDGMVHRASDDDWSEVLGSHLSVAVELTRAMAGSMRASRFGRIVYLGGAAGLIGNVGQASYAVAKAALFGLTRAVALEMAGRDVCVNYLVPFAFTRMTETIPPVTDRLREFLHTAPLARPEDLAALICWLCSDSAAGLSGQVIGGRGGEVTIWSQPRPVTSVVQRSGWCHASLNRQLRPGIEHHLTPLESEFDLFASDAVTPVERSRA